LRVANGCFKVAGSDAHVVGKMFDYMKAHGISKIAIMTDSSGYGASAREEFLRLPRKVE